MDEVPVSITFYRHCKDVDDLGLAVSREISSQLRQPPRDRRHEVAQRAQHASQGVWPQLLGVDLGRGCRLCHEAVQLFFDFVGQHAEALHRCCARL